MPVRSLGLPSLHWREMLLTMSPHWPISRGKRWTISRFWKGLCAMARDPRTPTRLCELSIRQFTYQLSTLLGTSGASGHNCKILNVSSPSCCIVECRSETREVLFMHKPLFPWGDQISKWRTTESISSDWLLIVTVSEFRRSRATYSRLLNHNATAIGWVIVPTYKLTDNYEQKCKWEYHYYDSHDSPLLWIVPPLICGERIVFDIRGWSR